MLAVLAMAVPAGTAAAQQPAPPANTGGAAYGVIPAKRRRGAGDRRSRRRPRARQPGRPRVRRLRPAPGRRAGRGPGGDPRRQRDRRAALPLRRRPPAPVEARHGLRLLGHRVAARCTAAACSSAPLDSSTLPALGPGRPGRVDHRLHAARATPSSSSPGCGWTRARPGPLGPQGPALAPDAALHARLQGPPSRRVVSREARRVRGR